MTYIQETTRFFLRGSISKPFSLKEIRLSISTLRFSSGDIVGRVEEVVGLEEGVVVDSDSVVVGCALVVPRMTHLAGSKLKGYNQKMLGLKNNIFRR